MAKKCEPNSLALARFARGSFIEEEPGELGLPPVPNLLMKKARNVRVKPIMLNLCHGTRTLQLLRFVVRVSLVLFIGSDRFAMARGPEFNRDVRPILVNSCFKCHGPDDAARKSGLRLDVRSAALQPAKSGATAIVAGHPDESELIKRIFSTDPDEVMPPPGSKQPLTEAARETLRQWITSGADYQPHWAFVPPVAPLLPPATPGGWAHNGIDQIVLDRLNREGLKPSPPADPYALVRRVYLDLIGLPPTPAEADAFAQHPNDEAYEALVDHLLASPHYGERWARRWLDLARYADSNGYEKDRQRNIWPWRDWVVRALNANMPFDQFTIEQIAGDLLPNATLDQRVATGFHRNSMLNEEGGIDPLEFRYHAMTDRVNTTATTWLGLTLGCAQCHTHKYDPIPHREYYQMMAFLDNADEPDLDLPAPDSQERQRANEERADRLLADLPNRFPVETNLWETPRPTSAEALSGEKAKILDDGSALFAGPAPDKDTYTLVFETDLTGVDRLRLETLIDDVLPAKGPGRVKHGNFVLSELRITAAPKSDPDRAEPVRLIHPTADVEQKEFSVDRAVDGQLGTGWAVDAEGKKLNANHWATFQLENPVGFPGGTRWVVTLDQQHGGQHLIGRPRISLGRPVADTRPLADRRRDLLENRFAQWLEEARGQAVRWTPIRPVEAHSNLPLLTVQPDDSVFVSGDITKNDTYDLRFAAPAGVITAVRLEVLPDERLPHHGPGMTFYEGPKGDFFLGEFQLSVNGQPIKFSRASHSYAKNAFGPDVSAALAIDGDPQTGWSTADGEGRAHEAVFVLSEPLKSSADWQLKMMFGRHFACSLGRFRISVTTRSEGAEAHDFPAEISSLLLQPGDQITRGQRQTLWRQFLLTLPEFSDMRREIQDLRRPPYPQTTLVLRERPPENPRQTFVHKRGEYQQTGEPVQPDSLSAVAPFPADWPRNRLGFACWLVSTNNPLTARVTVNRQWQAFFGQGIVRTLDDFGFQGEPPSHPELIDWLAVEFMRQGWSLKQLHRLMVTSSTYRQSSRADAEQVSRDPQNRLLARGPHGRLEAEVIRDSALRASGLLAARLGGPSVYPPQPPGVMEVTFGGATWPTSEGEDRYRRSLYTFTKRTAPFALYNTFDGPTGESCLARREVSNTPLQALTLLNDVVFIEASQAMGRNLAAMPESTSERVREAFRRCLVRPPDPAELEVLSSFLQTQRERFASRGADVQALAGDSNGDPAERAAWTALSRALLNLDEMITKD